MYCGRSQRSRYEGTDGRPEPRLRDSGRSTLAIRPGYELPAQAVITAPWGKPAHLARIDCGVYLRGNNPCQPNTGWLLSSLRQSPELSFRDHRRPRYRIETFMRDIAVVVVLLSACWATGLPLCLLLPEKQFEAGFCVG
jgi:hypothetical protein